MLHLSRNDYADSLALLAQLERDVEGEDAEGFARAAVETIASAIRCELVTLSVCDLASGHRQVVALPQVLLSADDIAAFDLHFDSHPLVRAHGHGQRLEVRRISDETPALAFRDSALFADDYRRIGIDHVIAVPLWSDARTLVSLVLNRARRDFSERERDRLELLRPHLAFLYRQACRIGAGGHRATPAVGAMLPEAAAACPLLSRRERQAMGWLACGKTDREIAALLGLSVRTVQKHLEHVYAKLGVETRTAAVMRALTIGLGGTDEVQ